jgi:hypothetical protein
VAVALKFVPARRLTRWGFLISRGSGYAATARTARAQRPLRSATVGPDRQFGANHLLELSWLVGSVVIGCTANVRPCSGQALRVTLLQEID